METRDARRQPERSPAGSRPGPVSADRAVWAPCVPPGGAGLHRALHARLREQLPDAHRAAAGHAGAQGQLIGGDRPGTGQPLPGGRRRLPRGTGRQPVAGRLSDRTTSPFGMRRPWMVAGWAGGTLGILVVAVAPEHPGGPGRLVPGAAVLQRPARRHGRRAARPGADRPARACRRCPRHLRAGRVGERDLPGRPVQRQPARHVPRPVRARRVLHPAVRCQARRPPAPGGGQAAVVAAGAGRDVLRQPARQPGLRLGVRQPVPARAGLRIPDDVPGLLPAGQARQRRGRRAPADLPGDPHPVRGRRGCLPRRGPGLRPARATEGLRGRCVRRVRPGTAGDRRRRQLRGLPGRHGHQRARLRRLHGGRPRTRRRCAAGRPHHRQGPRRAQHGGCPAVLRRAGPRARPCSRSGAAATSCSTSSPVPAPSPEPPPSCR